MLENGKHVLCEKPLCINAKQTRKLLSYAKSKNLFIMEATWSRFFPCYQYVRELINKGDLGDIKEVNVSFGFELDDVERLNKKSLGGGTILDLGIYTIQLSQWIFNEKPISITGKGKLNSEGVDIEMKGLLTYSNGKKSIMMTSAIEGLDNTATVIGTRGQITVNTI